MKPAFSVIGFTVAAGLAQGLVVALAAVQWHGVESAATAPLLLLALVLLVAGLIASFFHLGRPERAWRAATMWRTSWLSREVIVLPAFIGTVGLWWLAARGGTPSAALSTLALLSLLLAALLWWCTAMIYACLRFIEEWAHPLTLAYYAITGLASGWLLFVAATGAPGRSGLTAVLLLAAALAVRWTMLSRNARLKPRSTLQSATGIRSAKLRQVTMGFTGGSFNTREFFHGAGAAALHRIRWFSLGGGFVVPLVLAVGALPGDSQALWWLALAIQLPGLIADRWLFFAQARHPQNLYYQTVS
jgi:DMSO reductase anchor subunit